VKFLFKSILVLTLFTKIYSAQELNYELKSIDFEGNNYISSSQLRLIITSRESPGWISKFFNSFSPIGNSAVYFDSTLIPIDLDAITNLYMSNGFFHTRIKSKYILDKEDKTAELTYYINEGEPAFINKIKIQGIKKIPGEFHKMIYSSLTIDTNVQYSDKLVDENRAFILNFLHDHGYMLAESKTPVVDIDTMKNKVAVNYKFLTGKRYKIGKIIIDKTGKGKQLVTNDLIREIADLTPGNYYSLYDLKRAQIRLYRTNLFTSALVSGVVGDTVGNVVPIKVSADVGLLHELSPEIIGINEDNTFKLGLGLSFTKKNFLGDARKFTTRISAAAQNIADFISKPSLTENKIFGYADARISFEQPFLFGDPIFTKLETYYTLQKKKDQYNARLIGSRLNLNFELPQYTYLSAFSTYLTIESAEYRYQKSYIENVFSGYLNRILTQPEIDSFATSKIDSLIIGPIKSKSTNVILGMYLGANKTDDFLFPTKGYSLSITLEDGNSLAYLASKIGGYNFNSPLYYKILINSSFFPHLFNNSKSAFGIKFKTGYIRVYKGNKSGIPLNQRFTAGGSNSVRGWKTAELNPITNANTLPENPTNEELESVLLRGIIPGGFFLFEGSMEVRTHLFGKFGSAVFIDYGNTFNEYKNFRFDALAVAFGLGFRYYSTFAPIRLDIGVKMYDPYDQRSYFTRLKDSRGFWNTTEIQIGIGEAF